MNGSRLLFRQIRWTIPHTLFLFLFFSPPPPLPPLLFCVSFSRCTLCLRRHCPSNELTSIRTPIKLLFIIAGLIPHSVSIQSKSIPAFHPWPNVDVMAPQQSLFFCFCVFHSWDYPRKLDGQVARNRSVDTALAARIARVLSWPPNERPNETIRHLENVQVQPVESSTKFLFRKFDIDEKI